MHDPSKTEPSQSMQLRIDGPCLRFEQSWLAGERPSLEAFVAEAAEGDRAALLEELLLLEWTYRRQCSEAVALDEYEARLAGWGEGVERAWQRWVGGETGADGANTQDTTPPDVKPASSSSGEPPAGYEDAVAVGRGGMGVVYRAFDPRLKRMVALKRVLPDCVTPERLRRFSLEAEAVARLRHPHVVGVYGLEQTPEGPVLVMEYVPGGSLEAWLRGRTLTAEESCRLVAVLARAVQAAHDEGVIHRDLKPENVLLAPAVAGNSGTVAGVFPKVTDFGLAMLAGDERQTRAGVMFGTPAYVPPEQARGEGEAIGPKSDVWSLGVILYRCLSGRLPFKGDSVLETLERVKSAEVPPLDVGCGVPGAFLRRLCLRCLEKEPQKRPTAAELAEGLERLAGQVGAAGPPRRVGRLVLKAGAMAVLCVLVGVLAIMVVRPKSERQLYRNADKLIVHPAEKDKEQHLEALAVRSLRVMRYPHLEKDQDNPKEQGEIGKDTYAARYDDVVRIEVELSEPAHAYLIAFTPDGKHVLLWPADEQGKPDAKRAPPRSRVARYHATNEDRGFKLDENVKGGTQAFVVVASRRPLPAFEEWSEGWKERPWRVLPARQVVYVSNGEWTETKGAKESKRTTDAPLPNQPLLKPLCRGLKEAGADVVEGIAFGVRAKEGVQ